MSQIEKLAIRGIRAFSPDREQAIEFESPLTMIVGANGCGKTTVIECLKFGTTGAFPPGSSSGKAFVHDPKVSGATEVKAQIKLRFKNYGAQRMVVVRSMQLTQKKTTATFKQLDGVIRATKPDGTKTSFTHKCGELDKTVPLMIGVSRAVLESVIFCHQEDSSWPLQEGAVLKKRFDDIFESARYTKALEVLQKQKKSLAASAKDISGDLKGLHADKVAAQDHAKRKASADAAIAQADACIKASDEKQSLLREEKERINDRLRKIQSMERGLTETKQEIDGLERSLKYLDERLKDSALMDLDDDVLTATAARLQDEEDSQFDIIQKLEHEADRHRAAAEKAKKEASKVDAQKGGAEAEKTRGEAEVADLRDALGDAKGDLEDTSDAYARLTQALNSSEPLDRDVAALVQATLDEKGKAMAREESERETEADQALRKAEAIVAEKRSAVENAAEEVAALAPKVGEAERIQRDTDEALRKLRDATDASLALAKAKVEKQGKLLDDFRNDRGAQTHDSVIKRCQQDERRLADEIEETNTQLNLMEGNEDDERELGVLEHAATQALDRFSDAYGRDAADLREAAEDYEQGGGGNGAVVSEPPGVHGDDGRAAPEFAARLKALITTAKTRLDDACAEASKTDASTKADERAAQQSEASTKAASREAAHACEALPSDTRSKLASIRKQCASLRDAEKAASENIDDENEADEKQADELDKLAEANGVFEWSRVDKGDDDLDLETLVTTPLSHDRHDAFQSASSWARGVSTIINRRKENVVMMPKAMFMILEKLRNKPNKKTGCSQCPVCKRDFDEDDDEFQVTVDRLDKIVKKANTQAFDDLTTQCAALQADLDSLEPQWRGWVATLKDKVAKEKASDAKKAQASKASDAAKDAASALRDAEALSVTVASRFDKACNLSDLGSALRDAVSARDAKKDQLDSVAQDAGVGGRRTRRDITKDLKRLQEEKEQAVNKRAQAEKDKAEGLQQENKMISQKSQYTTHLSKVEQDLAEKKRLESSRDDATKAKRDCEKREKEIKANETSRKAALDKARRDQDEATQDWTGRKKKARARTNGAKAAAYAVQQAVAQATRGDKRIADAEATLEELKEKRAAFQQEVDTAEDAVGDINEKISEHTKSDDTRILEKKDVEANLEYRAQKKKKDVCVARLEKAQAEVEAGGDEDEDDEFAGKTPLDLQRRAQRITAELEQVASEKGEHVGKKDQARKVAREHANDLATSRYKGVEERHRRAMIDKETTEMACKDVEHYWTALDKALGSFHRLKIEEINRIIKELWSVTYLGEDIDTIEIVSGEDNGSKRAARSYNYHVRMRKQGAALDMKGRCSAGQRVLASIVIRLALAQTFCIKCGILALDEPTTNLDEANRRSLAHGLSRIIAERARQSNFQLVVITHDEEFIATLRTEMAAQAGSSMPEHYWRISREEVGQGKFYSKIDKIPMDQLQ